MEEVIEIDEPEGVLIQFLLSKDEYNKLDEVRIDRGYNSWKAFLIGEFLTPQARLQDKPLSDLTTDELDDELKDASK